MSNILNDQLQQFRDEIDQLIKELHDLTVEIKHSELESTVSDLRNRIREPFMFVIVGEVKAGKSSFINALLATGKDICKVAPSPMTDTVQQIVYGEQEEVIIVSPHLKKIRQPVDILKEIAIVDTPGTNTIVDHHQEITERFIPASDLIVFVFEAKNPYRQSAWQFFDFIHSEWHKKIIFVLQQKDLMNTEDLAVNLRGVREQAEKKGIQEPHVFAVSAKQEQEGQQESSGFVAIRDYISANITGGKAPALKLHNNISISKTISGRIREGLDIRQQQWDADVAFRDDIRNTLDEQELKSAQQIDTLVDNLLSSYDRSTMKTERELESGLSFFSLLKRSFTSMFNKKASAKEWLNQLAGNLESDLNRELKDKLNEGVLDIADSIQQMAKLIHLKIQSSSTILKNNHDIFSDIAERRSNVLHELQAAFSRFMNRSESFTDDELFPDKDNLSPNLATGSGLAVVGVILTAVANGAVFDITGGILTTIGLLFAGFSAGIQKRKVLKGYRTEIEKGRNQIQSEVSEKLKAYVNHIKSRIDANFGEFDQMLEQEKAQISHLDAQHQSIEQRLDNMADHLKSL